jgi:hypothetical protein
MQLEHANMTVLSIEKAMQFLGAVFPEFRVRGEGLAGEGEGHRRWLHFGTDSTYISMEQLTTPPATQGLQRHYIPRVNHLCFEVDDLDAVNQRLVAAGFSAGKVMNEPENEPFRKRAYIFDGQGSEWEFVQYLFDEPAKKNIYL